MLTPIENVQRIQSKDREFVFKLFSFENKTDFDSNEILLGQSVIFISERYENEGKY